MRDYMEEGKDYQRGYDDGYDAGGEYAYQDGYDEGRKEAYHEMNRKMPGESGVDNMCLKCDCRKYGFDCVLEDPMRYMENKLLHGDDEEEKPKRKKVTNPDYDRAMEIFHPK